LGKALLAGIKMQSNLNKAMVYAVGTVSGAGKTWWPGDE
jgi:hypothetical protein